MFYKGLLQTLQSPFAALVAVLNKSVVVMSNSRFAVVQELRQLIGLAGPLVFTQLAQMGMGVVDTVMAGRLGAVNLAGVALGGWYFGRCYCWLPEW